MHKRILIVCFLVSGAAGLVYQISWIRILSLVFGNTVYAVSMVVAAFLAGLAIGSFLWGKRADSINNPLDAYIKLEALIAISAVLVTFGIYAIDDIIVAAMNIDTVASGGWLFLRFILIFVILVIPTALMGGTTPLMAKVYVKSFDSLGLGVGSLYAANTYGAMAGAFFSGFLLVPLLGLKATIAVAVFLNLGVAVVLKAVNPKITAEEVTVKTKKSTPRKKKKKAVFDEERKSERKQASLGVAFLLILLSGFCVLAYEIIWTRAFVVSFKSTVYLFGNLLTVFLLGMALGSHFFSKWLDKAGDPLRLFGLAQVGIGVFGILSAVFFIYADGIALSLGSMFGQMSWAKDVIVMFVIMLGVFLAPTFLMGLGYPIICRAATRSLEFLGRDVGAVYAVGTAGGIGGSLVAGFMLLPLIGLQKSLFVISALSLGTGYIALLNASSRKGIGWVFPASAAFALMAFVTFTILGINIGLGTRTGEEIVFAKEGIMGTVRVTRKGENGPLTLMVNNYQLATSGDVAVRFGHIPLLLKPDAKEVLLISLGSGITAGSVSGHQVDSIESVEIVPTLLDVQPLFEKDNHKVIADRRFKLTFWDGRHYVRVAKKKYDLVISDLFQPDSAGVGNLYSLEHFQNVKEKLKEGGAMAQWLPLYQLSPENLKIIMKTFAQAFENVTVWYGDINSRLPTLMLFGSQSGIKIDPARLAEALEQDTVKEDMIEHLDPLSFLSFFVMGREGVIAFTEGSPINTDNSPVIEYSAPRNIWNRNEDAVTNFEMLISVREKPSAVVMGAESDADFKNALDRYFNARTFILRAKVDHARRNYVKELKAYQEAARYAPGDPYLGFALFDLGYLYYVRRDFRMASEILGWSKKLNPNLLESYFYLAKSFEQMGRKEEAHSAMRELALLRPDIAEKLLAR